MNPGRRASERGAVASTHHLSVHPAPLDPDYLVALVHGHCVALGAAEALLWVLTDVAGLAHARGAMCDPERADFQLGGMGLQGLDVAQAGVHLLSRVYPAKVSAVHHSWIEGISVPCERKKSFLAP